MAGLESLLTGRLLGNRYRIEEVIGRGGMGAVYRATDERLGRSVAVKVITVAGAGDPEARERLRARFYHEARAAAALPHHPNVVPVYDYGTDEALGLDFLVMELLRGEDLATRLARKGPPPLGTALWVLREAAKGVAVGHRARLVHRDVKPGNIFLATGGHGDELQVRVLDFGIAKLIADEDTLSSALTQDGRGPHSPAYASPEQLRGLGQITPASDVFSLGAVGYQLVTGERAFTDVERNLLSLGERVPLPSVRERNPAAPTEVDEILRRALAFDAVDRFPDAGAFAVALAGPLRELSDSPDAAAIPAPPPLPVEPPRAGRPAAPPADDDHTEFLDDRTLLDPSSAAGAGAGRPVDRAELAPIVVEPEPKRRRKRGIGGILVWTLVLLLLGGAAAVMMLDGGGEPQRAEEIPPPPDSLAVVDPEVEVDVPTTETETQPELAAFLDNREGVRFSQLGDYPTALEHFRRAVAIAPDNAEYRNNFGVTLHRLGMHAEARDEIQQAIRLNPNRDRAYVNLADAQLALGDTAAALEALERFVQVAGNPRERALMERRLQVLRSQVEQPEPSPIDTTVRVDTLGRPRPIRVPPPSVDPGPRPGDTIPAQPVVP